MEGLNWPVAFLPKNFDKKKKTKVILQHNY